MRLFARYIAFQIPGVIVAALTLWGLHRWVGLPSGIAWILFGLWVAKELALFPFLRQAYDTSASDHVGAERLLGATAVADEDLAPRGYVRVRGELWRAELVEGGRARKGDELTVQSVRDLTLLVQPRS